MLKSKITLFLIAVATGFGSNLWAGDATKALKSLPVQDAGRVKPFDTFAREALQMIYGRQTYSGRSACDVVFTWMLVPEHWDNEPIVEVRHAGLREALKLPADKLYFAPIELMQNERVGLVIQELRTLRQREKGKFKINPYYQAVQALENKLTMYQAVRSGLAVRVAPDASSDTWQAAAQLADAPKAKFAKITEAFVAIVSADAAKKDLDSSSSESKALEAAVSGFTESLKETFADRYADARAIAVEVHLNNFRPFLWSWIFYLVGVIFLLTLILGSQRQVYSYLAWSGVILGFLASAYGMALRIWITGRPPVTNMYETVVWVPWGAVLFSIVLVLWKKNYQVLLASASVSILCLVLSDLAPSVLDASIHPLEPVLRDNFWLTTHVLVITLSYGAFFLAFGLGDLVLIYYLKGEQKYATQIAEGSLAIYRAIQIGVVLLAAGTILGGVWADYSWGRFWGWDPKETWAFIALMGYIAILHGRIAGYIRNFGTAAFSVVAFSLVIMAWYGVNFVLGAGLHSYGFGAGGVEYVSVFVAAHLLFVIYVATVRQSALADSRVKTDK